MSMQEPEGRGIRMGRRKFLTVGAAAAGAAIWPRSAAKATEETGMKPAVGFMTDPIYLRHITGDGHPERPQRLTAIIDQLKKSGLWKSLQQIPARDATMDQIRAVQDEKYIQTVIRDVKEGRTGLSTGDTVICPDSLAAAIRAVGGVLAAGDAVVSGKVASAFCAVRPPGHHATRSRGMGFCIFNNVAALARYLQKQHKLSRVLIVDWDVHHGNGTQDIFYEDGSVMYFSTHQHPMYPGTGLPEEIGSGKGKGCIINCPLPRGSGDREILAAFDEQLLPAARKFKPQFVIISAGFDARQQDSLGGLNVTDPGFAQLTARVVAIANEFAGGKLVSVLEGGYNLAGLALAAESHVQAMS